MGLVKTILFRLTFLIYECNLRAIGRYNQFDDSTVGSYQRSYFAYSSRFQVFGVLAFNLMVFCKTIASIAEIRLSFKIMAIISIGVAFIFFQVITSNSDFYEFIQKERKLNTSKRMVHHLMSVGIFFILPGLLIMMLFWQKEL